MKQFDAFTGKRVFLNVPGVRYVGTFEHEDNFFVYLMDCTVMRKDRAARTPYAVIRKSRILEMRIIGGEDDEGYPKA